MASGASGCRIQESLGVAEVCPGERCPFWESGHGGLGGCAFEKINFGDNPEVAEWLLRVRKVIEAERES